MTLLRAANCAEYDEAAEERSIVLALDGESELQPPRAHVSVHETAAAACRRRLPPPPAPLTLAAPPPLSPPFVAAHTLGNALRDVMWAHPHVQLASYTQEHPSSTDIIVRCQTSGAISAEQGVAEALQMTQGILCHMSSTMAAAVEEWQRRQGGAGKQQQQQQPGGDAMDDEDS